MAEQGGASDDRSDPPAWSAPGTIHRRLRPIVVLVIAFQLLIPAVMLGLRHIDPARGQVPFGWQMHTDCWGMDDPICDR